MKEADISYIQGAVHDICGPVVNFIGNTPRGVQWLRSQMGISGTNAIIEDEQAELTVISMANAGLSVCFLAEAEGK